MCSKECNWWKGWNPRERRVLTNALSHIVAFRIYSFVAGRHRRHHDLLMYQITFICIDMAMAQWWMIICKDKIADYERTKNRVNQTRKVGHCQVGPYMVNPDSNLKFSWVLVYVLIIKIPVFCTAVKQTTVTLVQTTIYKIDLYLLKPFAKLDRDFTARSNHTAKCSMWRGSLRKMIHSNVQVLKFIVAKLTHDIFEKRNAWMRRLEGFQFY